MSIAFPLLLVGVVLFIGALVFIAFAIGRRSKIGSVAAPCCAACRYPVEGLTSLTCPECGCDLRRVGILTPAMGRPYGPWPGLILWTLLLPIPALALSGLFVSLAAPIREVRETTWDLQSLSPVIPRTIELKATATRAHWPPSAARRIGAGVSHGIDRVELHLTRSEGAPGSPAAAVCVDLESKRWWTLDRPDRRPLIDLDAQAVRSSLGFPALSESAGAHAARDEPWSALVDLVRAAESGRHSSQSLDAALGRRPAADYWSARQTGAFTAIGPHPGAMLSLLAFWVLLWLAGCRFLYRRARPVAA